jgi:hypothetical protein
MGAAAGCSALPPLSRFSPQAAARCSCAALWCSGFQRQLTDKTDICSAEFGGQRSSEKIACKPENDRAARRTAVRLVIPADPRLRIRSAPRQTAHMWLSTSGHLPLYFALQLTAPERLRFLYTGAIR